MPYIKDKVQGYGEQAGVLGSGAVPTGKQATQAGSPGSFTNIQDYLSGVTAPKIQNQIENKAQGDIRNAQANVNQQVQGLSALPTAQQYNPESFQKNLQENTYDQIKAGATQAYNPTDPTKEIQTPNNPFTNIQPGSFSSLMNYFGQTQKPNTQYGQGAQKLDEMFLRGKPEYVQNFAPQKQEQFKAVEGQAKKAQEERGAAQKATQEDVSKNASAYQQAINDYLSGVNTQAQQKLAEQQAQYKAVQDQLKLDPNQLMEKVYGQGAVSNLDRQFREHNLQYRYPSASGGTMTENFLSNAKPWADFFNVQGAVDPTLATASGALGADKIQDYNALRDIQPGNFQQLQAGQEFNPGKVALDYNKFLTSVQPYITEPGREGQRRTLSLDQLAAFLNPVSGGIGGGGGELPTYGGEVRIR